MFLLSASPRRSFNEGVHFLFTFMPDAHELIIDEQIAGHFFWTLVQQTQAGEKPLVIDFAMGPLPSKQAALDAGKACMMRRTSGSWGASMAATPMHEPMSIPRRSEPV
jgi:hypothetical protein